MSLRIVPNHLPDYTVSQRTTVYAPINGFTVLCVCVAE
jgi:hypothetical protein